MVDAPSSLISIVGTEVSLIERAWGDIGAGWMAGDGVSKEAPPLGVFIPADGPPVIRGDRGNPILLPDGRPPGREEDLGGRPGRVVVVGAMAAGELANWLASSPITLSGRGSSGGVMGETGDTTSG